MRMLRVIVFLLLAAFAGLAGYAYFGDMSADPRTMRVPVQLDLGDLTSAPAPTPGAAPADQTADTPAAETPAAAAPEAPDAGADPDAALD